ncbi:GNAT family N-acetyltransferase [Sphingomonas sp. EC-HK361]|uniref:GNAT family N-acetyltransferase n=1 Tax=Sphingomonas sp. EC-HK361 TaxID=2038397 RepID=UPI001258B133|nr:GNAT family N-acetyltransferase [Sphingomonas sp. EC-HK361]VVT16918.1 GNAT family N-acetyltransferase [Sphingomonas sp. EC-HK361]
MSAAAIPLKFQVGARTLVAIPRRLVRVAYALTDVLASADPALPPLEERAHGYLVTSLPGALLPALARRGMITFVRQHYTRYFVDLAVGEGAWRAALSGQMRSTLKRKAKKLAQANGGTLDIRGYRAAEEVAAFHLLARAVSATTYQERLLDSGLPADPGKLIARAAADEVRAWLLFLDDAPIAYLCCQAVGTTLRYDFVGHDPAYGALSPGTVLMERALGDLFGDRFAAFDFTEGEGQHKRGFATGGVACCDVLLLRPTVVNRATVAAIGGFDALMAMAKRWSEMPALNCLAKRVRR